MVIATSILLTSCGRLPPVDQVRIDKIVLDPAAITFVEVGASHHVTIRAYSAQGSEIEVAPGALRWSRSEGAPFELVIAADSLSGTLTATELPGHGSIRVTLADGSLSSAALVVTTVALQPESRGVSDAEVLFPLPQHLLEGDGPPSHWQGFQDGNEGIAGFRDLELAEYLEVTSDGSLLYPAVLTGATPELGEVLFGTESAPILGRVLQVESRDGVHLVQLESVEPSAAFSDYVYAFDTDVIGVDLGVDLSHGSDLKSQALDCRSSVDDSPLSLSLLRESYTLVPIIELRGTVARASYKFGVKLVGEISLGIDVQSSLKARVECDIGSLLRIERAIPAGWLAALLSGYLEMRPTIYAEFDASGGPRFAWEATLSGSTSVQVGYDCPASAAPCENVSGLSNDWGLSSNSIVDPLTILDFHVAGSAGLAFVGDAGLRLGGLAMDSACRLGRWLPSLAEKCRSLRQLLKLDILNGEIGAEARLIYDSPRRVLNSRKSDSAAETAVYSTLELRSRQLEKVWQKLGISGPQGIPLASFEYVGPTLFRAYEEGSTLAATPQYSGTVSPTTVLEVAEGDHILLTVIGKLADPLPIDRSPLVEGQIWIGNDLLAATAFAGDDALTFEFDISAEMCDSNPEFQALGFSRVLGGLLIASYLGAVEFECAGSKVIYEGTIDVSYAYNHAYSLIYYYKNQAGGRNGLFWHDTVEDVRSIEGTVDVQIRRNLSPGGGQYSYSLEIGDTVAVGVFEFDKSTNKSWNSCTPTSQESVVGAGQISNVIFGPFIRPSQFQDVYELSFSLNGAVPVVRRTTHESAESCVHNPPSEPYLRSIVDNLFSGVWPSALLTFDGQPLLGTWTDGEETGDSSSTDEGGWDTESSWATTWQATITWNLMPIGE